MKSYPFCDNLREVNIWLVPWIQFHNPVLGNKVENRILHHWEAMSFFGLAVLVLGETVICDSYINRPALRRGQAPFAHLKSLWLGTNEQTYEKSSMLSICSSQMPQNCVAICKITNHSGLFILLSLDREGVMLALDKSNSCASPNAFIIIIIYYYLSSLPCVMFFPCTKNRQMFSICMIP